MSKSNPTFIVRVRSGGRVTIPEPVRDAMNIRDGDIVELMFLRFVKRHSENSVPSEAPEMTGRENGGREVVKV